MKSEIRIGTTWVLNCSLQFLLTETETFTLNFEECLHFSNKNMHNVCLTSKLRGFQYR